MIENARISSIQHDSFVLGAMMTAQREKCRTGRRGQGGKLGGTSRGNVPLSTVDGQPLLSKELRVASGKGTLSIRFRVVYMMMLIPRNTMKAVSYNLDIL